MVAPKGAVCISECLSSNLALQDSFKRLIFPLLKQLMWEDDYNSDPFAGIDVDLLYADSFEQQQAEIDPESYENLFGGLLWLLTINTDFIRCSREEQ